MARPYQDIKSRGFLLDRLAKFCNTLTNFARLCAIWGLTNNQLLQGDDFLNPGPISLLSACTVK